MRYLTCFEPSASLIERLRREPELSVPASGFHVTIWGFNIHEHDEQKVINALLNIAMHPFSVETKGHAQFDFESYALMVSKPKELIELHREVIAVARPFDKDQRLFDKMVEHYGLERYSPHITLSKSGNEPELRNDYSHVLMPISECSLLKKKDGFWKRVSTFNL